MEDNDILIATFTGILQGLGTFIAMHHVMVAQQSFYVICAVQFLACLSPMCLWSVVRQVGGQETWLGHGIETSGSRKEMHGIFCTSASLSESGILSRMLVCGGVLLQPYLVAKALWQFTQMLYSSTPSPRHSWYPSEMHLRGRRATCDTTGVPRA